MRITILCVGKLKESFWRGAVEEYLKRLSRYVKLTVTEVPDERTPDGASEKEEQEIRDREGERLIKQLRPDDYVAALAIEGNQYDSIAFSKKLEGYGIQGKRHVVFVIGGSLGLSDQVLARADERISFSRMTFPHQLMRVILLEQIYRGYRIMKNEPYHK